MAFGVDDAVAAGATLLNSAINKIWPDPAQQASAEALLMKTAADAAIGQMTAQMAVVIAEAKSEHWLAASWRPIVMLTFAALITARWCGLAAPGLGDAEVMKLWDIVQFGLGGYVAARSVEKIAATVSPAIAAFGTRPAATTVINTGLPASTQPFNAGANG